MTAPPPRRPWWRRKLYWTAIAIWLAFGYPLGMGPLTYATWRGWISPFTWGVAVWPIRSALPRPHREIFVSYLVWWGEVADRHNAASD